MSGGGDGNRARFLKRFSLASGGVLLVNAVDATRLDVLVSCCRALGLEPLVEAATEDELDVALATEATLIGVNSRDLRTFTVDRERAAALVARIPVDRVAIQMSGVKSAGDFGRVSPRADAVLIGEHLMRAADPEGAVRGLLTARQG